MTRTRTCNSTGPHRVGARRVGGGDWGGGEWGWGLERPDGGGDYDPIRHGVLNGDVRGESTTATTRAGMHLPAYVCVQYDGVRGWSKRKRMVAGGAPELLALALDGNDMVPSHLRLHVSVRTGAGTVCSEAQARGLEVNCCCWREVNCEQESEQQQEAKGQRPCLEVELLGRERQLRAAKSRSRNVIHIGQLPMISLFFRNY